MRKIVSTIMAVAMITVMTPAFSFASEETADIDQGGSAALIAENAAETDENTSDNEVAAEVREEEQADVQDEMVVDSQQVGTESVSAQATLSSVTVGIYAPKCGNTTTTTTTPSVYVEGSVGYAYPCYWCTDETASTLYSGSFKGGSKYYFIACIKSNSYTFGSNTVVYSKNFDIKSAELGTDGYIYVVGAVTAAHRNDDYTGVITQQPTAWAMGVRSYYCSACGAVVSTSAVSNYEQVAQLAYDGTLGAIPKVKGFKVKGGKNPIVSWKKLSKKQRKKYDRTEIQFSQDGSFNRSTTYLYTGGKTMTKGKAYGLPKKKTYYVRIRNVKGSGVNKTVSKWSKVKKIKVK